MFLLKLPAQSLSGVHILCSLLGYPPSADVWHHLSSSQQSGPMVLQPAKKGFEESHLKRKEGHDPLSLSSARVVFVGFVGCIVLYILLLIVCVFSATLFRPGLLLYPGGGAEVISSLCCLPAKKLGSAVLLPLSKRTICFSTDHGVVSPPHPWPSPLRKYWNSAAL